MSKVLYTVTNPHPGRHKWFNQTGQVVLGLPGDDTRTMIDKKITLSMKNGERVSFEERELSPWTPPAPPAVEPARQEPHSKAPAGQERAKPARSTKPRGKPKTAVKSPRTRKNRSKT